MNKKNFPGNMATGIQTRVNHTEYMSDKSEGEPASLKHAPSLESILQYCHALDNLSDDRDSSLHAVETIIDTIEHALFGAGQGEDDGMDKSASEVDPSGLIYQIDHKLGRLQTRSRASNDRIGEIGVRMVALFQRAGILPRMEGKKAVG